MSQMKILINGGGIAGNALAFWLSKLGHDITVVERFPSLRATGLQVDLRGHGVEVMKRMGLEQAFLSKSVPEQGIQMVGSSGKRHGYFPANRSGKGVQSFSTEHEIMRGDLCTILYEATKHRAKYVFGTSVESFAENKDASAVDVRFADGKTDRYDLVVGADGVRSRTRKMMLGPDELDPFYPLHGNYIAYFSAPCPIQKGEEYIATFYMGTRSRCILTRRQNPHNLQVYFICNTKSDRLREARKVGVEEEKKVMSEMFKGVGWRADEFIEALNKDKSIDFYCEQLGVIKLDSWSRGRVVLLGDAAYCPTPNTGMGTTSAVVGAYILAGEIERHCGRRHPVGKKGKEGGGLEAALKAYDQKFRPFMDQVQTGLVDGKNYWEMAPQTRFGLSILNSVISVASFLRLDYIGKWFLREEVKGWPLPEYEELFQDRDEKGNQS